MFDKENKNAKEFHLSALQMNCATEKCVVSAQ